MGSGVLGASAGFYGCRRAVVGRSTLCLLRGQKVFPLSQHVGGIFVFVDANHKSSQSSKDISFFFRFGAGKTTRLDRRSAGCELSDQSPRVLLHVLWGMSQKAIRYPRLSRNRKLTSRCSQGRRNTQAFDSKGSHHRLAHRRTDDTVRLPTLHSSAEHCHGFARPYTQSARLGRGLRRPAIQVKCMRGWYSWREEIQRI